ncbi:hypothetical protein BA173_06095 [Rickettsia sp. MEAM1 (Bemisia tabaci)]|uniref:hypothetical protein n=1 Tax=unclassified Rickettsia TaxID=114295 RepID=UPI0002DCB4FD|nr:MULTISPECIES: hypothetical protein [unclassified Rickettsia]ASX28347.1 hypothetical protein BA173_06095 [Rickettsia sp. MEAM1 (Bemisia tabaci)]ODA36775.1 hypothetical protein A8V33_03865 [Rickettsia sp. wb]ODA38540.1 hypothetical protein A8V34_04010 [Rickettsia sp. wq]
MSDFITDTKLYEIAIANKQHVEDRRDEINNYYISLFAALVASIPFIEKITTNVAECNTNLEQKYNKPFITNIVRDLERSKTPRRITKHQLVIPYTFISIFSLIIIYMFGRHRQVK